MPSAICDRGLGVLYPSIFSPVIVYSIPVGIFTL
nr:MAG TPA: hypothetical protein [Bacteriophage sp.]